MITRLAGTTFNRVDFPISVGDDVTVKRDTDNPHDNGSHPAYGVYIEGCRIGYIPTVETAKKRMLDARQANDLKAWERHREEVNLLLYLRDCIYVDIERNHINPIGHVSSVRYLGENGWNDHGDGDPLGISVRFDYQ